LRIDDCKKSKKNVSNCAEYETIELSFHFSPNMYFLGETISSIPSYFALLQPMLTILSATNRLNSQTARFSEIYTQIAANEGVQYSFESLTDLPDASIGDFIYRKGDNPFRSYAHRIFDTHPKILVIVPEYNASIPGILKLVIDCADPEIFKNKRIALTGIASGRGGNIRGLNHLTEIFHYLKAEVYSNKLPISMIRSLLDENMNLRDEYTLRAMQQQLHSFVHHF
jgi:NAD(P)H-dependent FMN reductase